MQNIFPKKIIFHLFFFLNYFSHPLTPSFLHLEIHETLNFDKFSSHFLVKVRSIYFKC
ncbi:unnamed protein product [Meloidogyne enterolobii]|uniref:Uncharacterized protein n=1 Tax=Meloidogyne enterolobii TaxID=390850 RepID=A0ACB0ZSL0_MELEN